MVVVLVNDGDGGVGGGGSKVGGGGCGKREYFFTVYTFYPHPGFETGQTKGNAGKSRSQHPPGKIPV